MVTSKQLRRVRLTLCVTCMLLLAGGLLGQPTALGQDDGTHLPSWVDSVVVSRPVLGGYGSVKLSGTWIDTCAPDAISHTMTTEKISLEVTQPGLNVGCGDALTPWSLTEEFGPGNDPSFSIYGDLVAVNPENRSERQHLRGPDLLAIVQPPRRAEFRGLGNPGNDAYVTRANDVSGNGRVVAGTSELAPGAAGFITSEAFAWAPETGRINLGLLPGGIPGGSHSGGISADGNTIVGQSSSGANLGTPESFRWSLGAGMQPVGNIVETSYSDARAASRDGRVIVGAERPQTPGVPGSPASIAYRWTPETGSVDLGNLYPFGSSEATDVSQDGAVVTGNSQSFIDNCPVCTDPAIPFQPLGNEPFRWTEETGMVGIGHLPSPIAAPDFSPEPFFQETVANAISAKGNAIVGTSTLSFFSDAAIVGPPNFTRGYRWTREGGMQDLGTLDFPDAFSSAVFALDTSGDGSIVIGKVRVESDHGIELNAPAPREVSFIWDERRGMRPLKDVLARDYGLDLDALGWSLGEVAAISDDGSTIVGTGRNPDGDQEAWRIVLGSSYRAGDTDFDGDVDAADLVVIADHLGMGSQGEQVFWSYGDFDGDGVVTQVDFSVARANFVPEPSGFVLLLMFGCLVPRRRR